MTAPHLTLGEGLTIGEGITISLGGSGGGGGGTSYVTWSGLSPSDNPHSWTTQLYGANTISIPWQWGGYNMTKPLPTSGETVSDTSGHTGTILSVTHNRGGSGDNLLITLTTNVPGFASDTSVNIT